MKNQLFRHKELRFYPRPDKLLGVHTVVFDKAHQRKRRSTEDTYPTEGFRSEVRAQQKIQTYRHTAGKHRKNELSERQSEKHTFRVVADFLVYLNFQFVAPPL